MQHGYRQSNTGLESQVCCTFAGVLSASHYFLYDEEKEFVVKMWSNQENRVRKQVKNPCEAVRYAMHSSGKNSLTVGLSPYKIAKIDALASNKLAGRLFTPFCMARSVHKIFTKN